MLEAVFKVFNLWVSNKSVSMIIYFGKLEKKERGGTFAKQPTYFPFLFFNIENTNNMYFLWPVLAQLHPANRQSDIVCDYVTILLS